MLRSACSALVSDTKRKRSSGECFEPCAADGELTCRMTEVIVEALAKAREV